jgi:hypothetical protein
MSSFYWTSASSTDPSLFANWTRSDGVAGNPWGPGDSIFVAAQPSIPSLASIGQKDTSTLQPPPWAGTVFTGAASTGGHLAQSTTYFYRVTATFGGVETTWGTEQSYTTPASGTATNQITLNWLPYSSGSVTYSVYRSTTTNTELLLASGLTGSSYADTSATTPSGSPPGSNLCTFAVAALNIAQSFIGTIGTNDITAATNFGYWKISATNWFIGLPPGDGTAPAGSGRIKLNFNALPYTGTVYNTGNRSTDSGYEPVRIVGTGAGNVLSVGSGKVGIGTTLPAEAATVATVNVVGNTSVFSNATAPTVNMGSGVTWTDANVAKGGTFTANSGNSGTLNVATGSFAKIYGTAKVTTINNDGTIYHNVRPSSGNCSDTINNFSGAVLDFTGNAAAGTVGALNAFGPTSIIKRNPANPGHITFTLSTPDSGTLTIDP